MNAINDTNRLLARVKKAAAEITRGNRANAILIYEEVSPQARDDIAVHMELGHLCQLLAEPALAVGHYEKAVDQDPENAVFLSCLGVACQNAAAPKRAQDLFEKAYAINPDLPDVNHGLGIAHMRHNDFKTARRFLERACELRPGDAAAHTNLATVLSHLDEYEAALEHAMKALQLDSGDQNAHYVIGGVLTETGRTDEAIRHFEKAIRQNKTFGAAYDLLARMKKFTAADQAFVDKAEKVLGLGMPAQQRFCVHYALGKIYDDLGQYDQAFDHYRQANVLKKRDVDLKIEHKLFKQYRTVFTADSLAKYRTAGHPSDKPVFIVGMPRSGTTLMEQMIASHPRAAGAGELPEIPMIAAELLPAAAPGKLAKNVQGNLTQENLYRYAERYLAVLEQRRESADRIVDKLPGNYAHVGLILALFPNATIIHALRHPLDTCLSCYFQNFTDVRWANDFAVIGETYRLYRDMMNYWRKVLPQGRIVDVHYESLIENPPAEGRRLIEACGLEWDESILDFHTGDRVIRTASLWQARQQIYKTSKQRWMNYAAHVGELANALAPYLQDEREALAAHGIEIAPPTALGRLTRLFA